MKKRPDEKYIVKTEVSEDQNVEPFDEFKMKSEKVLKKVKKFLHKCSLCDKKNFLIFFPDDPDGRKSMASSFYTGIFIFEMSRMYF
jgi:hypothetical protein